jgi:hypothetical protein
MSRPDAAAPSTESVSAAPANESARGDTDATVAAAQTPSFFPRVLDDIPYLLLQADLYAEDGSMWENRTWLDPADGSTWTDKEAIGSANQFVLDLLYLEPEQGHLWHFLFWQDASTGSDWRTFEDLGVAEVSSIQAASLQAEPTDPVDQP